MHEYERYIPVIVAALAVLVLGWLNPLALQTRNYSGKSAGCPSYLWLSLAVLLIGSLCVWGIKQWS